MAHYAPADAPQQLASLQEQGRNGGKGAAAEPFSGWSHQESAGEPRDENTRVGLGRRRNANLCECKRRGEVSVHPRALLPPQAPPVTVWVH